ncbi:hypothetical protein [Niastella populi]|uniref:Uncharacterized protein n=1 Tax=Niastella populi TaxID=550983 RepID=A0A1V9GB11_9BACT|nr:hypothetical protein [Niastella populi]OQP67855.1 hypothetical protein A4R26_10130 [Niastella populi]
MKKKRVVTKKRKASAAKPKKVLLPCDPEEKTVPYSGRAAVGSIILKEGKLAVVALAQEPGDHHLTEGYIFVPDDRMEPSYKKGDRIGICRKVQMQPFFWGCEYYVVDQRRKGVLCRIYPSMKGHGNIILRFKNKKYRLREPRTRSLLGFFLVEPLAGWPKY